MTRLWRLLPMAVGLMAVPGCAAAARTAAVEPTRLPDCSFRSASTCWTLAGRFPTRQSAVRDTMPELRLDGPPPVLAAASDSIDRHPDTLEPTESR